MASFSVGRGEDDNEEGPSSPTRRPVPKRQRTSAGTCSAVRHQQEQEQERERERERERKREERVVEEEEEDWFSRSESGSEGNFRWGDERRVEVRGSEVSRGNRTTSMEDHLDRDLEGSRGHGSISVMLSGSRCV